LLALNRGRIIGDLLAGRARKGIERAAQILRGNVELIQLLAHLGSHDGLRCDGNGRKCCCRNENGSQRTAHGMPPPPLTMLRIFIGRSQRVIRAGQADTHLMAVFIFSVAQFCERLLLRSEEYTSELQSRENLVCRLLLEKKKKKTIKLHVRHKKKS